MAFIEEFIIYFILTIGLLGGIIGYCLNDYIEG